MYTSFLNNKGGANATASSSRGFKNRNIRNAPPTRDELQNSMQTSSLLKLSQRILGGKAVVSLFHLPPFVQSWFQIWKRFRIPLAFLFSYSFLNLLFLHRLNTFSATRHLSFTTRTSDRSSWFGRSPTRKTSLSGSICRRTRTSQLHSTVSKTKWAAPTFQWSNQTQVATSFSTSSDWT